MQSFQLIGSLKRPEKIIQLFPFLELLYRRKKLDRNDKKFLKLFILVKQNFSKIY